MAFACVFFCSSLAALAPVDPLQLPVNAATAANLMWTDASSFVQNSGFNASVISPYARLPLAAKNGSWCNPPCPVRDEVWEEGQNGAGLYLGFQSDADDLWLNATLLKAPKESTVCSAVCGSGLDLYAFDEMLNAWRWVDVTKNSNGKGWGFNNVQITRSMFLNARGQGHVGGGKGRFTRYRFHLPIYNGLAAASLGVPSGATIKADNEQNKTPPILWYGTSIVNGHVASRSGMIFTNSLSRMLGRDVINLGFGGNGKMETAVGRLVAEVKQAAMVVIDCNWNMDNVTIATSAPLIVRQLRAEWSATKPIVLAEGTSAGDAWINPSVHSSQAEKRAALAHAYALLAPQDTHLYYVHGDDLMGKSGAVDLPTAQGTHPDDLGHHMIAEYYAQHLPPILAGGAPTTLPTLPTLPTASLHTASTPPVAASAGAASPDAGAGIGGSSDEFIAGSFSDMGLADLDLGYESTTSCGNSTAIAWTDARTLGVGGRADWGGLARENWWDRFPLIAKADVTSGGGGKGIWGLSKCTPSEYVSFSVTGKATALYASYDIHDDTGHNPSGGKLSIMPPLGRNGVDLYAQARATNAWVWAGNTAGSGDNNLVCGRLSRRSTPIDTTTASRFMLYLPLWRACDNLTVGIPQADYDAGVRLVKETSSIDLGKKPIVWYGTSILHGAASTRAGMSFALLTLPPLSLPPTSPPSPPPPPTLTHTTSQFNLHHQACPSLT
jgi:hypothetical protein